MSNPMTSREGNSPAQMGGPDIAKIAAGLTKAQREALSALSPEWQPAPSGVTRQSVAALKWDLCERGWPHGRKINCSPVEYRLTPLGLAVRAHLKEPTP
jgi:hypothetical protein